MLSQYILPNIWWLLENKIETIVDSTEYNYLGIYLEIKIPKFMTRISDIYKFTTNFSQNYIQKQNSTNGRWFQLKNIYIEIVWCMLFLYAFDFVWARRNQTECEYGEQTNLFLLKCTVM